MYKKLSLYALALLFLPVFAHADCALTTMGSDVSDIGFGGGPTNLYVASRFVPSCTGTISVTRVRFNHEASTNDDAVFLIQGDTGSAPDGVTQFTSDNAAQPGSGVADVDVTWTDTISVVNGVPLWLVATRSNPSGTGFYAWEYTSGTGDLKDAGAGWVAANTVVQWSATVVESGGGGGGGDTGGATSTPDQTQQNIYNAFTLFFVGAFFVIWLLRKH